MSKQRHPAHIVAPALARYSFHLRHGFFGRKGGVSKGCYATLNAGSGSGDNAEHVSKNRLRISRTLGYKSGLITARQAHSNKAIRIDSPDSSQLNENADALVTNRPGLVLAVMSADCIPILACDPKAGIIAAIHVGWRGSFSGIIESALEAMTACGANINHCIVALGPALGRESFEVGPELVDAFVTACPWSESLFESDKGDRCLFDHSAFVSGLLVRAGVRLVETLALDTFQLKGEYFSYRRARKQGENDYGRNASAIVLLE